MSAMNTVTVGGQQTNNMYVSLCHAASSYLTDLCIPVQATSTSAHSECLCSCSHCDL